jgi:hypothetical protein
MFCREKLWSFIKELDSLAKNMKNLQEEEAHGASASVHFLFVSSVNIEGDDHIERMEIIPVFFNVLSM